MHRAVVCLLFVLVALAASSRPCDGKGPCDDSSSQQRKRSSSSHSKEVRAKAASHDTSSTSGEECKFECPACQAPEGHASLFIGKDVIIDDADGVIKPVNTNCRTKHGTQYAYKAINPKYDIPALRNVYDVVVGRLYCKQQELLCVEASNGYFYHGKAGELVDVKPVPYTAKNGKTRIYLAVVVHGATIGNDIAGANATTIQWKIYQQNDVYGESYAQMSVVENGALVRRLAFDEYNYNTIVGVDCNGCQSKIKYVDKAIKKTYAK